MTPKNHNTNYILKSLFFLIFTLVNAALTLQIEDVSTPVSNTMTVQHRYKIEVYSYIKSLPFSQNVTGYEARSHGHSRTRRVSVSDMPTRHQHI